MPDLRPPRARTGGRRGLPPRMLGPYHVLGAIGRSAVGALHLARLEGPGGFQRWAAMRIVDPERATDEAFKSEFFERARAGAALLHPNVAALFDVGETDGALWLATEYLQGERVEELISRVQLADTPVAWAVAARIVADAAEGLHALHSHRSPSGAPLGLLHGDVAPHSVVVTYDGKTKIKGAFEPRARGTLDARKLAYAAPEQLQGESVDAHADVFALGVILWELCSGARLFARATDEATREQVLACAVPPLSTEREDIPSELEAVAARALAPSKSERFESASELARALEGVLVSAGVVTRAEDVGAYMRALFADRHAEREAELYDAADVTEVYKGKAHGKRLGIVDLSGNDSETDPTSVMLPGELASDTDEVLIDTGELSAETGELPTLRRRAVEPSDAPSVDDEFADTRERPKAPVMRVPLRRAPPPPLTSPLPLIKRTTPTLTGPNEERSSGARAVDLQGPDTLSRVWVTPSGATPDAAGSGETELPTSTPPPSDVMDEASRDLASSLTPIAPLEARLFADATVPLTPLKSPLAPLSSGALPLVGAIGRTGSVPPPPGALAMPVLPVATPGPSPIPRGFERHNLRAIVIGATVGLVLFALLVLFLRASNEPEGVPSTDTSTVPPQRATATASAPAIDAAAAVPLTLPSATTTAAPSASAEPTATTPSTTPPAPPPTVRTPPATPPTTPPRKPTPPPPPPQTSTSRSGLLTVICVPACDEVIDGSTNLGPSPIFKKPVALGKHRLTLKGEDGTSKSISVEVTEGAPAVVRQRL